MKALSEFPRVVLAHTPTPLDLEAVRKATNSVTRSDVLSPVELPLMSGVCNAGDTFQITM